MLPKARFLTLALSMLSLLAAAATPAEAAYTVFRYNLKRPGEWWVRTDTAGGAGYYPSVDTTWTNCVNSIRQRLAENKKYNTSFEVFIILYSPWKVPEGKLQWRSGMRWYGFFGAKTFGPHSRVGYY